MAKQFTDEEARNEARKRFGERAEEKLQEIKHILLYGGGNQGVCEEDTRELRRLLVSSQFGASKFLEISDLFGEFAAGKLKDGIPQWSTSVLQETKNVLQKASEVFLELAAIISR